MGTFDTTIYTASCDVGDCEELFGDEDYDGGWSEFSSNCEDVALRGGWTKNLNGLLICEADDEEHQAARAVDTDPRPRPGPGQLLLC